MFRLHFFQHFFFLSCEFLSWEQQNVGASKRTNSSRVISLGKNLTTFLICLPVEQLMWKITAGNKRELRPPWESLLRTNQMTKIWRSLKFRWKKGFTSCIKKVVFYQITTWAGSFNLAGITLVRIFAYLMSMDLVFDAGRPVSSVLVWIILLWSWPAKGMLQQLQINRTAMFCIWQLYFRRTVEELATEKSAMILQGFAFAFDYQKGGRRAVGKERNSHWGWCWNRVRAKRGKMGVRVPGKLRDQGHQIVGKRPFAKNLPPLKLHLFAKSWPADWESRAPSQVCGRGLKGGLQPLNPLIAIREFCHIPFTGQIEPSYSGKANLNTGHTHTVRSCGPTVMYVDP